MEVLLRYVRQGRNGVQEILDTQVSVDAVTIGSASDSTVQLLGRAVASEHARIDQGVRGLRVSCRDGEHIEVNGKSCTAHTPLPGDVFTVGGHRLIAFEAPAGFDLAIEVQPDTSIVASDFEAAFVTDLGRTWLSMRAASWLLLALALTLGLIIPLATVYSHRYGTPTPRALPDDTLWTSGPLTPAHAHAAGKQCNVCHQQLFLRVQNAACQSCHKDTFDHVPEKHRQLVHLSDSQQRCGECHAEHLGDASRLVVEDDHLCTACHARPDQQFGALKLSAVSGFQPDRHPAFQVTLQRLSQTHADALTDRAWITERAALVRAHEQSNLTFSHAAHLDPKVRRNSEDVALTCADCHTLGADGEHFQPPTMAKNCANSGCHLLNFDVAAGQRQLPHGKPQDAVWMIEDYFTRKFFDPAPTLTAKFERRLPDTDRLPTIESEACIGTPLACARQHAKLEIENQFLGRGCHLCHHVDDTGNPDIHDRFEVTPVRLEVDYFPAARFPHKAHEIQGKLSGDEACVSCHAVRKSKLATDLSLPNVDRCLECHRDEAEAGAAGGSFLVSGAAVDDAKKPNIVTLRCISCHGYHPSALSEAARQRE